MLCNPIVLLVLLLAAFVSASDDLPVKACYRDAEARGRGVKPNKDYSCPVGHELSGALCYKTCANKFVGVGPVCWTDCARHKYSSNGLVFCCETDEVCSQLLVTLGKELPEAVAALVIDIAVNAEDVVRALTDFKAILDASLKLTLPKCSVSAVREEETQPRVVIHSQLA